MVLQQGLARLHNVHDHIGQAQDGGQLDGTVELDDIDVPGAGIVIFRGDVGELGGHPQLPVGIVIKVLGPGHAHAALAHLQVQQFVHIGAVLQ